MSFDWAERQSARQHMDTPAFQEAYSKRGRVEPKIWELVRHGARRCRYRGDARSQAQLLVTVSVVNCKRIVRLLDQREERARAGRSPPGERRRAA